MASIPLVALNARAPEQPDVMEKYGQLLALKNAQQQSQMQQQEAPLRLQALQQQTQTGEVQLQQQQQALKDQQAMTAAMQQWDGKDINALEPLVLKNGGSGQAVMGLKQKSLELKQTYSKIALDDATTGSKNIETAMKKGDMITGALSPLVDPTKVPDAQLPQALAATVQDLTQRGLLDPQHAQAAAQLVQSGNPQQIRAGIDQFTKTFMAQSQIAEQALKTAQTEKAAADASATRGKIDPTSPFYAPTQASIALGTAPGAAQIQAGEVRQAARKAGAEESARLPGEMALAKQRQALSQGDPEAAAQLLVDGDATLSELKARGATADFIAKTLFYSKQKSGGKYNAQAADANFQVAKSPANVAFFGSAKSLTEPGGTLDQLAAAAKDIPGSQIPVFNTIEDATKAAAGSGPLAKYASILLGVSDDYSKVMGGGQGSDSSRTQALHLVPTNASPEARAGAIEGIRGSVGSQIHSRIGKNPVLQRMYGDDIQAAAPGGNSGGFNWNDHPAVK